MKSRPHHPSLSASRSPGHSSPHPADSRRHQEKTTENCHDIMFVIDTSGSMDDVGEDAYAIVKNFLADTFITAPPMQISPISTRISVVLLGNNGKTKINLLQTTNLADMQTRIRGLTFMDQRTNTGGALQEVRTNFFSPSYGNRGQVKDTIIIFTDGERPSDQALFDSEKARWITEVRPRAQVFVVQLYIYLNRPGEAADLTDIAPPGNRFIFEKFSTGLNQELSRLIINSMDWTCPFNPIPPTPPPTPPTLPPTQPPTPPIVPTISTRPPTGPVTGPQTPPPPTPPVTPTPPPTNRDVSGRWYGVLECPAKFTFILDITKQVRFLIGSLEITDGSRVEKLEMIGLEDDTFVPSSVVMMVSTVLFDGIPEIDMFGFSAYFNVRDTFLNELLVDMTILGTDCKLTVATRQCFGQTQLVFGDIAKPADLCVTSSAQSKNPCSAAIDGLGSTAWKPKKSAVPHYIEVNLLKSYPLQTMEIRGTHRSLIDYVTVTLDTGFTKQVAWTVATGVTSVTVNLEGQVGSAFRIEIEMLAADPDNGIKEIKLYTVSSAEVCQGFTGTPQTAPPPTAPPPPTPAPTTPAPPTPAPTTPSPTTPSPTTPSPTTPSPTTPSPTTPSPTTPSPPTTPPTTPIPTTPAPNLSGTYYGKITCGTLFYFIMVVTKTFPTYTAEMTIKDEAMNSYSMSLVGSLANSNVTLTRTSGDVGEAHLDEITGFLGPFSVDTRVMKLEPQTQSATPGCPSEFNAGPICEGRPVDTVKLTCKSTSARSGNPCSKAIDGRASTAWKPLGVRKDPTPTITITISEPIDLLSVRVRSTWNSQLSRIQLIVTGQDPVDMPWKDSVQGVSIFPPSVLPGTTELKVVLAEFAGDTGLKEIKVNTPGPLECTTPAEGTRTVDGYIMVLDPPKS